MCSYRRGKLRVGQPKHLEHGFVALSISLLDRYEHSSAPKLPLPFFGLIDQPSLKAAAKLDELPTALHISRSARYRVRETAAPGDERVFFVLEPPPMVIAIIRHWRGRDREIQVRRKARDVVQLPVAINFHRHAALDEWIVFAP